MPQREPPRAPALGSHASAWGMGSYARHFAVGAGTVEHCQRAEALRDLHGQLCGGALRLLRTMLPLLRNLQLGPQLPEEEQWVLFCACVPVCLRGQRFSGTHSM